MTSAAEKTKLARQYSQDYMTDRWFIEVSDDEGLWNLRQDFDRLISIQTDYDSYTGSQLRYLDAPHVVIIDGEPIYWVTQLLQTIEGPCFFWLDGPWNSQTLEIVLRKPEENVILIEAWDEENVEQILALLEEAVNNGYPASDYEVDDRIVRIVPKAEMWEEA